MSVLTVNLAENSYEIMIGSGLLSALGQRCADAGLGQAPVVPKERPRTLAAARQQKGMLAGEKMKQDGGTNKRGRLAVDVTGTSFGSYDAALVAAASLASAVDGALAAAARLRAIIMS